MSLGHGAKTLKIVKDGLILNLDAANLASYQGSGTTFKDIVGTHNATLGGGISYSSNYGGEFTFDGVDDIINFGTSIAPDSVALSSNFSLDLVFSPTGYQPATYYGLTNILLYRGNMSVYNYQIQVTNSTTITFIKRTSTESLQAHNFTIPTMTNLINHIIFVIESNTTLKCYLNSNLIDTKSISGGAIDTFVGSSMPFAIGHTGVNQSDTEFIGKFYTARIYNKALSATEVQTNYLAMSRRYGI